MAGSATYKKVLRVSNSTAGDETAQGAKTWANLPIESADLSFGASVIEDTELSSNDGYRTNILGLLNWSISAECVRLYGSGDGKTALDNVRAAISGRSKLYVQYLPQGVSEIGSGFYGEVVVENFNQSGGLDDKEMTSISFQPVGALSVANTATS